MDPLTVATLLFSGISKVKNLFTKGKELISDIKGEPSASSTPEDLKAEFEALSPDQQKAWVDKMAAATNQYEAETERLKAQEGISSEIADKVDAETASKIAYQRQTTRPWAVRMCMHLLCFPFYLIALDVIQNLIKNWFLFWTEKVIPFESFVYVFGSKDGGIMDKVGNLIGPMPKTMAGQMYIEAIVWAAAIVISYMGLREAGKFRDKSKGDGILGKIKKTGLLGKFF